MWHWVAWLCSVSVSPRMLLIFFFELRRTLEVEYILVVPLHQRPWLTRPILERQLGLPQIRKGCTVGGDLPTCNCGSLVFSPRSWQPLLLAAVIQKEICCQVENAFQVGRSRARSSQISCMGMEHFFMLALSPCSVWVDIHASVPLSLLQSR